jgi:hypothetical protein
MGGVQLVAKDAGGKVLGSGTTAPDGKYRFAGVPQGPIDLFCTPPSGFQPGSGTLTLTDADGCVDWQLSNASPATAAQAGTCDPAGLTGAEVGSITVLGLAGAGGIAGLVYGLDQGGHPSSPAVVKPISRSSKFIFITGWRRCSTGP